MYIEWKEMGLPATQRHKNKVDATNNLQHPLAQQVETWPDKKTKVIDLLGLTNKSKLGKIGTGGTSVTKDEELQKPIAKVSELDKYRAKWRAKIKYEYNNIF